MARLSACALASIALFAASHAYGQSTVWRCLNDGRSQYTNIKKETVGKSCTVVSREVSVISALSPAPAVAPASARPADFPRVDRETQRERDDTRRRILEQELTTEQNSLSAARARLAEQESARGGDERNYQKVLDRLQPFQEAVARHERNVAAIRREIAGLR
ncbi:MAG: hypothetical protein M5U08_01320 [Burkholderiales bacterium]|nr:hypothetical protein [Burkholderiales bacterium]